ncbi:MAG: ATP-binding protein [Chitinispirillaceae bacterium]
MPLNNDEQCVCSADQISFGVWKCDYQGKLLYLSPSFLDFLDLEWEDALCFGWLEHIETKSGCEILEKWQQCISLGVEWEAEFSLNDKNGTVRHVISKGKPVRNEKGDITEWNGVNLDITNSKKLDHELNALKWLLTHKHKSFLTHSVPFQPYGDLSQLNTKGEILNSVGKEMLLDIAGDFLELLYTSAAIFERNGSYAVRITCSPWCRLLDRASRENCQSDSNADAMNSGKWHCHNACWKNAHKSIVSGQAHESICEGGIPLFSTPIKAGSETIGAVVIGLGNPPTNPKKLKHIAQLYGISYDELLKTANNYHLRPEFIVDFSKNRLFFSARMIGTIVERKRAEAAFHKAFAEVERRVESRTAALSRSYELLREETRERKRAEQELFRKHAALESVYSIATIVSNRLEELHDRVIEAISNILQIPYVALGILKQSELSRISQIYRGQLSSVKNISSHDHPCGVALKEKKPCQFSGDLNLLFPEQMNSFVGLKSYIGIPILSNKGELLGSICAMDLECRVFTEYEFHQIEIFSRYIAREIEQRQLEKQLRANQEMRMLGQLTSGVAHEVRNPLNGILAITEALNADLGEDSEYSDFINHIRNQVTRLSDLMRDLLDLGRPVEKTNLQPSSVPGLISKALLSWSASSKYKNRSVVQNFFPGAESCIISADRAKMQQVFINLLENACEHSSSSSEIVIEVENSPDNNAVRIKVIDQGDGIKEEYLEHLFEPFFTTRKSGTGLGLGIVKRIIESHGGSIRLENNTPPPGCTVEICLQRIDEDVEVDEETNIIPY